MKIVLTLLIALMCGAVVSLVVTGIQDRGVSRARAARIKVLEHQADSLETALAFLETERLQTAAKVRTDSIATAEASKKVGPVVSRDTATETAVILIEGTPRMAPLQLVEKTDALERENASLRIHNRVLEEIAAHAIAAKNNALAQLAEERATKPSRLERLASDAKKVTLGAAGGALLVLLLL